MSKSIMNIAKGVAIGMAAGSVVGFAVRSIRKPKSKMQKNAAKALNTVSSVMQNMADIIG